MAAALEAIRGNNILYVLRNFGFNFFVDIARTELAMELPECVICSCELCELFFRKENILKFMPYVKKKINELKSEKLVLAV